MKIGAQLYTLHDFTKTLEDFEETLKKVAEIGYKEVQISGFKRYIISFQATLTIW